MREVSPNLNVWERLFPFDPRRDLVVDFVGRLIDLPCVEKIATALVPNKSGWMEQKLLVFTHGEEPDGSGGVWDYEWNLITEALLAVCADNSEKINQLGGFEILTEDQFWEERRQSLEIRYQSVTMIWERCEEYKDGAYRRRLNPFLN